MHHDLKDIQRTLPAKNHGAISLPVVEMDSSEPTISRSLRAPITGEQSEGPALTTGTSFGTEICVGIIDEYPFTRECISSCLRLLGRNLKVLSFSSIEDFVQASVNDFDLVLFHVHGGGPRQQSPDETMASIKPAFRSCPVIILSDLDAIDSMLAAFESGARGYIPTGSTSVAVAVEVIRLVRAGGIFVPPSLRIMNRPPSTPEFMLEEPLTSRQMAVLYHLAQGKANKIIAYELKMSESTVKVHIRNIMKKMQATNRTEVAFRARNIWSAERHGLGLPPQAQAATRGT